MRKLGFSAADFSEEAPLDPPINPQPDPTPKPDEPKQETPIMSQNSQNRQILQELNRRQGEAAQKEIEVLQKVFNPSAKRSFNKTGFLNL